MRTTCLLADKRGLDAVTPAQRRVVLVWAARGINRVYPAILRNPKGPP
ncbi:MAG TPA: hypothetical protein VF875_14530 [Anaeromyxobacter sp.]